jgi:anti-anti-sigma factor
MAPVPERHGTPTSVKPASCRACSKQPGVRAIILDAETIPFVDISAVNTLAGVTADLKASGVDLVLAHDIGQVRDLFRVAGADHLVDNVYPTVQLAVDALAPTQGGDT